MPASDLTDSDRRFLEVAITCLKEPPQLDVPRIAEILGIKNKSVTNKWWEIKKKLWGVEVARAAGEKTRQLATAAGVKRKREAKAANPAPPTTKPAKEKVRWYPAAPAASDDVTPSPTTATSGPGETATYSAVTVPGATDAGHTVVVDGVTTAMEIHRPDGASDKGAAPPSGSDGGGSGDSPAYAAAAADVTSTPVNAMTTTTIGRTIASTTETEVPTATEGSEPDEQGNSQEVAPTENDEDVEGHVSDGNEAGVV